MLILETIQESFETLIHNKMRTFLSILGIIIGIGSVIALISLGESSQAYITDEIESFGINNITIRSGNFNSRDQESLTMGDVEFLRQDVFSPYFSQIIPNITVSGTLTYNDNSSQATINGVDDAHFADQFNVDKIELGQALSEQNQLNNEKVLVVGSQIATDLFDTAQGALNQQVKYQNQFWTIVGVLAETGLSDSTAYAPIGAVDAYVGNTSLNELSSITAVIINSEEVTTAENLLNYAFMQRRGLTDPDDLSLSISSLQEMLDSLSSILGIFTGLLSGIAAISLLVGGIGIMNIMLVTVTERTREIGLRQALGAKKKTIITQFLIEAMVLTVLGGFFGFFLGIGISYIATIFLETTFVLSATAVVLGVGVSTLIGIVFGIYPAWKAAKLQPIEALRYD